MSDVTELIATHDQLQTRKDGGVRSIATGLLAKQLRDALEAEHAEVVLLRAEADANWPCDGGCNVNDGPDEMCSRHGRRVSEVWQMAHDAMQRAERAEEQLQAIREWAQGLIRSDDMTRWGDHCPNTHGRQALAILDITDGGDR